MTVEAKPLALPRRTVVVRWVPPMPGKKQTDATQNLRPDEPTQVLPKGTKTGLPTRGQVENALAKIAKKKPA
jgi:hypothetical protein